jgi:hypothetical protein
MSGLKREYVCLMPGEEEVAAQNIRHALGAVIPLKPVVNHRGTE